MEIPVHASPTETAARNAAAWPAAETVSRSRPRHLLPYPELRAHRPGPRSRLGSRHSRIRRRRRLALTSAGADMTTRRARLIIWNPDAAVAGWLAVIAYTAWAGTPQQPDRPHGEPPQ
jgi:hypothetical protein